MQIVTFNDHSPRQLCAPGCQPLCGVKGKGAKGEPMLLCAAHATKRLGWLWAFSVATRGIPGATVENRYSEENGEVDQDTQTVRDNNLYRRYNTFNTDYDRYWAGATSYAALKTRINADFERAIAKAGIMPDVFAGLCADAIAFNYLPQPLLANAYDEILTCTASRSETADRACIVTERNDGTVSSVSSCFVDFDSTRQVQPTFLCFASCAAGGKIRVPIEVEIRCSAYYRNANNDDVSPAMNRSQLSLLMAAAAGEWDNDVGTPFASYQKSPTRVTFSFPAQNLNGADGNSKTTTFSANLEITVPESRIVAIWPDLDFLENWMENNLHGHVRENETDSGSTSVRHEMRAYHNLDFRVTLTGSGTALPV